MTRYKTPMSQRVALPYLKRQGSLSLQLLVILFTRIRTGSCKPSLTLGHSSTGLVLWKATLCPFLSVLSYFQSFYKHVLIV